MLERGERDLLGRELRRDLGPPAIAVARSAPGERQLHEELGVGRVEPFAIACAKSASGGAIQFTARSICDSESAVSGGAAGRRPHGLRARLLLRSPRLDLASISSRRARAWMGCELRFEERELTRDHRRQPRVDEGLRVVGEIPDAEQHGAAPTLERDSHARSAAAAASRFGARLLIRASVARSTSRMRARASSGVSIEAGNSRTGRSRPDAEPHGQFIGSERDAAGSGTRSASARCSAARARPRAAAEHAGERLISRSSYCGLSERPRSPPPSQAAEHGVLRAARARAPRPPSFSSPGAVSRAPRAAHSDPLRRRPGGRPGLRP